MKVKQDTKAAATHSIEVVDYTKKFKKFTAVEKVTFAATPGSIHGFIGPNGAGKTTTIKALIGAYSISDGKMLINGFEAGTMEAKKDIGYIPERASFPSDMNTLQYLRTMIELAGIKSKDADKQAREIIEQLGLTKHMKRKPKDFSSGMKKKVLIAQALVLNPSILILDEPAANLDPAARRDLFDTLRDLASKGKTIFISSHILSEMQGFIDEVTFIFGGKVRYSGSLEDADDSATFKLTTNNDEKAHKIIEKLGGTIVESAEESTNFTFPEREIAMKLQIELTKAGIAIKYWEALSSNVEALFNKYVEELGTESGVTN